MTTKHSVSIRGHRTSFSLEDEFWQELVGLAADQSIPVAKLVTRIDEMRDSDTNLSSSIRLYVLAELQKKVIDPAVATGSPENLPGS